MKYGNRSLVPMLLLSLGGIAAADEQADGRSLTWEQGNTSLALLNHGKTVWRLVFDPEQPKSYFHPLASMDGRAMTAFQPADHIWHRGLWWSWKFINGVNYWEENPKTGKSDGFTRLVGKEIAAADDFSAKVRLDFQYHPPEHPPLLTEKRHLVINPPDAAGTYVIEWESEFTAEGQAVKLDRTLPAHLGGVGYGGYAGLSLRMAKGLEGYSFRSSEGAADNASAHGKPARWVDLSGPESGIAILDHPRNPRHAPPWYLHSSQAMLFFSPAPLFNESLEILPGQSVSFNFRVIVHSKPLAPVRIDEQWRAFIHPQPTNP